MKVCARLLVGLLSTVTFLTSSPVLAQVGGPEITESRATFEFGQVMRFALVARGEEPIEKVTLFFKAPALANTFTADIDVDGATEISTEYPVDLTQLRLAPFTTVTYWWQVRDIAGRTAESPEQSFEYVDDQFDWHRLERAGTVVHWTDDNTAIGQAALDVVSEVLPRLQSILPVEPVTALRVYIYRTAGDIRAALRLTGRDWIGSHANPELGVILVSAANPRTARVDLEQKLPHELSHLMFYWATGAEYDSSPKWLDEGIATLIESESNASYDEVLREAIERDETIPFSELCTTFPDENDQAALAYAQSASMVRYIQTEYGNGALSHMVREAADGADCQTVITRTLGISLTSLNQAWLRHRRPASAATMLVRRQGVPLTFVAAGFVLLALLLLNPSGIRSKRNV